MEQLLNYVSSKHVTAIEYSYFSFAILKSDNVSILPTFSGIHSPTQTNPLQQFWLKYLSVRTDI